MATEELPKEFEKTAEVLPFTNYGLTSLDDFRKTEQEIQHLEWLRQIGLTSDEIKLYQDNESGAIDQRKKIECNVLREKFKSIYKKIHESKSGPESTNTPSAEEASVSYSNILEKIPPKSINFYPEGHPMNDIKKLEESLFGHLKNDILPITKRRKILRRLERRKERIMAQGKEMILPLANTERSCKPGSLWDVKDKSKNEQRPQKPLLGPKKQTMYTVKDNKIVRLEPITSDQRSTEDNLGSKEVQIQDQQYRAEDIVLPVNPAEEHLLEGTKMSIDDIKKIDRFKDYKPGIPSKVLYIKNISASVTLDQLTLLFNQFQLENGGPIDVRLLSGRMRGQAFVSFNTEELAIRALDEVNGTILSGKPLIVQFGRNTNRIQDDNR